MDDDVDEYFMKEALSEAKSALLEGEIPVGCIFVGKNNNILCRGHNTTNRSRNGTSHAEIVAMTSFFACNNSSIEDICGSTLYVSCEPCIMCAAAIARVGIPRVVFGCKNERFGGNGSILDISKYVILL